MFSVFLSWRPDSTALKCVFMLSVCLSACWYWQKKITHLAGMACWLVVRLCACVCVCACVSSLLPPDYLAATACWHVALWSSVWTLMSSSSCPDLPSVHTNEHTHACTHPGGAATTVTFSSSFGTAFNLLLLSVPLFRLERDLKIVLDKIEPV